MTTKPTHIPHGAEPLGEQPYNNPDPVPVEPLDRQTRRKLEQKGRKAVEKHIETLEQLVVEYVPIDSIYPNPYNPNRQTERDFELLKKSISEDGFTQPVLVHRASKQIIDGEHRWRAMHQLGFEELPVVWMDMTPEQMRISTLRHNRARGSEDIELSIKILRDLRELGALDHAVDSLSIDDTELQALLDDLPAPEMMASDAFSQAWVPSEISSEKEDHLQERVANDRRVSISDSAMAAMRAFDAQMTALEEQGSPAEGGTGVNTAMREANYAFKREILAITASFTPADSEIVRAALNPRPAERLLQLALAYYHLHPDLFPESVGDSVLRIEARLTPPEAGQE